MEKTVKCCAFNFGGAPTKVDAKLSQDEIKNAYDSIAKIYDAWAFLTESRARQRALELSGIENGMRVLEVAVGTGIAFREIVERNAAGFTAGIDLSEGMLRKAKKKLSRRDTRSYELKTGNANALSHPSESFDILFNNYMFDLLPFEKMDAVINEFRRVLKPNGRLVLVNMTAGRSAGSRIYDVAYRLSPKLLGGCRDVEMVEKLERNGFHVERREYIEQMLFPSEIVIATKKTLVNSEHQ